MRSQFDMQAKFVDDFSDGLKMNILSILFMLLIAAVTGAIGANLAGRKKLGCITSIVLGFIGALIGTLIAQTLDLPLFIYIRFGSHHFPVIWAVIGAALFVAFLNLFTRPAK
jgi:uncharacterized membrane protein YeaQ/YmgE (transglycosylase-associated protein family)